MNTSMERKPLILSIIILTALVLIIYLSNASPELGFLGSIGTLIVGFFKLIYWAIALLIGIAVCIAFLIGIFLASAYVLNKESVPGLYARTKASLRAVLGPVCCKVLSVFKGEHEPRQLNYVNQPASEAPQASAAVSVAADDSVLKQLNQQDAAATQLLEEIKKLGNSQEELHALFTALHQKIASLEEKNVTLSTAADQIESIIGEVTASGKALTQVREHMSALQGKLDEANQKVQSITTDKLLGDLPTRLAGLEAKTRENVFDPQPLSDAIAALQKDIDGVRQNLVKQQQDKKDFDPRPLNDAVAALQKDISAVQQNIEAQQKDVAAKIFDPQPLHDTVAALQKDIADLKQNIADQQGSGAEGFDAQALNDTIAALQQEIEELKKKNSAAAKPKAGTAAKGKKRPS